jgi:hypothetical protein
MEAASEVLTSRRWKGRRSPEEAEPAKPTGREEFFPPAKFVIESEDFLPWDA